MTWYARWNKFMMGIAITAGLAYFIYAQIKHKLFDQEKTVIGRYFAYRKNVDGDKRAVAIWRDWNCDEIAKFSSSNFDLTKVKDYNFISDTTTIPVGEMVELLEIRCDSTVAFIRFRNKYFHAEFDSSNRNPTRLTGLVSITDLHRNSGNQ